MEHASAFARRLGVNRSTISRAIQSGRLLVDDRGLLDVQINMHRWAETIASKRPDVAARHQDARSPEDQASYAAAQVIAQAQRTATHAHLPELSPREQDGLLDATETEDQAADLHLSIEPGTLNWWMAQKIRAQNDLVLLEMGMRAHRRYDLADITHEARAIGAVLRLAFDRMVDQIAPTLALQKAPERRHALIQSEVATVRRVIRLEFPRSLRRLRVR